MTRKQLLLLAGVVLAIATAAYADIIRQTCSGGNCTLRIQTGSTLDADSGATVDLNSGATLTNAATATHSGTNTLTGDFNVASGGNIQFEGYDATVTGISYTLLSADATANGVTIATGLTSIYMALCQVVTSANVVGTSDAKIQWSSGSLSILDGSSYNTVAGSKVRCVVTGSN